MRLVENICRNDEHSTPVETPHLLIGFVPATMTYPQETGTWIKAGVCSECGSLNVLNITEAEKDHAEERYMKALVETDNLTEREAREILGKE